jgi:ATP-dependent Clp protease adaptor protein ClpS
VEEDVAVRDTPWNVIVWNDPVNLMSYVVLVFRRLFGYSKEKATKLMLEVHNDGRSMVISAAREQAEMHCHQLHRPGLEGVLAQVPEWLASVGRPGSDPAADRLTPHAYMDDEDAGAEFDRLMIPELDAGRRHDREAYDRVLERASQGSTVLDADEVFSVLRVLDEVRLVMASRLGIDSDDWQAPDDVQDAPELHLYHLLGWLQDALIEAAEPLLLGDE